MPIEFHCVNCQKLLRVSDTAAGKKARCPDCGTIQETTPNPIPTPAPVSSAASPLAVTSPAPLNTANPFAERADSPFGQSATIPSSANPYLSPQPGVTALGHMEVAQRKCSPAGIAMIVIGVIQAIVQFAVVAVISFVALREDEISALIAGSVHLLGLILGVVMIFGGRKMQKLESYPLAMAAAVSAMIPCSQCCIFSLPIGIWCLIVLLDAQVKAAFRQ